MYIDDQTTKNRDHPYSRSSSGDSQQQAFANRLGSVIESYSINKNENEIERNSISILREQYYQNELDGLWHNSHANSPLYQCGCFKCLFREEDFRV